MIVVTIALKSAIHSSRDRILAEVHIANDGTGDENTGNYTATLSKHGGMKNGVWKRAVVRDFPRKTKGALDLLYLVLRYALKGRNP